MRTTRTKTAAATPRDVNRWCATFEARCRERGVRLTPQRLAVYRALAADHSHPTAETVYARVRAVVPTLAAATVYRILESFERERLVRRVSTTTGVARFDANLESHQHLVCRICGRMVDHFEPVLEDAHVAANAIPGFVVEELDVRLVGHCSDCSRTSRSKTPVGSNVSSAPNASKASNAPNRRRT